MRHRKRVNKLGRTVSHRKAMLKNMAIALIEHRKIRTTLTKAKALQGHIERLISFGKEDTVHSRRLAFKFLQNRTLVKTLFDEIAPTYDDRNGGYTRIIKLGQRRGDGAQIAFLQLVGFEELMIDEQPKKKKQKPKSQKKETATKETATAKKISTTEKEADIVDNKKTKDDSDTTVKDEQKTQDLPDKPENKKIDHKVNEPKSKTVAKQKKTGSEPAKKATSSKAKDADKKAKD